MQIDHIAIPLLKVGTPFQVPFWRYEVLSNPVKFGLQGGCSVISKAGEATPGCLKRVIRPALKHKLLYTPTKNLSALIRRLPPEQASTMQEHWRKWFNRKKKKRIEISDISIYENRSWNLKKVAKINDEYLRRLILHQLGDRHDEAIAFALKFVASDSNKLLKQYIGCFSFAGLCITDLAKKLKIPVSKLEAVRQLFFDFSHYPEDIAMKYTLLRQMLRTGNELLDLDPSVFSMYKLVNTLGYDGLLSKESMYHVPKETRRTLLSYFEAEKNTVLHNLQLTVTSSKDYTLYLKTEADFHRLSFQRQQQIQADLTAELTRRQIANSKTIDVQVEDVTGAQLKLLNDLISQKTMDDAVVEHIDVTELRSVN